jgi:hypothetical protein
MTAVKRGLKPLAGNWREEGMKAGQCRRLGVLGSGSVRLEGTVRIDRLHGQLETRRKARIYSKTDVAR